MVRILLLSFLLAALTLFASAQTSGVEQTFEKNKARYTREHFVMGEDASSGYDYLFYKSGPKIVKIRSIWSASYTKELRIEDFYFDASLVLLQKLTGSKSQLSALKKGRTVRLIPKEKLHFTNSKLTTWIEKGKTIERSDARWAETEKSTLEHAKGELESYDWLKNDNE